METTTDFIYLWVDGNDPKWLEKKRRHGGDAISSVGRYVDNQELKYSLRSVEKHIPWIRKIFIVTDNQIPKFLDTKHSKIEIVDHTEIIPKEYLPSFNSSVIEHFIHNIPNLSEHFLFSRRFTHNENVKRPHHSGKTFFEAAVELKNKHLPIGH